MLDNIQKIAFIGAGNMAKAIIRGLLNSGVDHKTISASARSEETRTQVAKTLGIECSTNDITCNQADVIVLAVKPQLLKSVCEEIQPYIPAHCLIISVAAGIRCSSIEAWLGNRPIVRSMPNTPSAIGLGASGLFANNLVSHPQKHSAEQILGAVGLVINVDNEDLIDAVTAVSGSGPAYFFLFIEAMIDAGVKQGLNHQQASLLAKQTALGASQLAAQSDLDVATLRKNVTSPKGTTEQAIKTFEGHQLRYIVDDAMQACAKRAAELSDELGA